MTEGAPDGVTVHRDVVHRQVEGYRPLALDLYLPVGEPGAVCIYVHGGGWLRGSRRVGPGPLSPTSSQHFVRAASQGLAIASVDYRLSGEARFPAQRDDIDSAIEFLEGDRDRFGLGDAPLVTWGVSAGGQLAALRALTDPGVRACALWYAVTDLRTMPVLPVDGGASREERVMGGTPAELPEAYAEASPITHVSPAAPPFLMLHGDQDQAVPSTQSSTLHDALTAAGSSSTFELVAGYDHLFAGMPLDDVEALVDRTVSFLLAP
ncbi:MAG: alpha/beta hydrolase [Candidatus Nanopelagicales bacterium]